MPLQELLAGTTTPPAAGPRVLFRRYTKCGPEAWRHVRIPPTEYQGKKVVFKCIEHCPEPNKLLPELNMLGSYVDEQSALILAQDHEAECRERVERARKNGVELEIPECRSIPVPSSTTSPLDREPPMRAEPAVPGPGLPTRSSRRKSSAPSEETTTAVQLRLDL